MKHFVVAVVLGFIGGGVSAAPDSPPATALSDYVHAPDSSFSWEKRASYDLPGAEVVELRLHSQTWQNILWKHRFYVIRPDNVGPDVHDAMLIIAGGRWRDSYETEASPAQLPAESALFIELAKRLGRVVAVIGEVPFQPMFGLKEDELIAYTFDQYLKSGDADWPLLLPMVKAAVKGMDAVQAFATQEWQLPLERFTVLGGSKRGWTTWLTGAVDSRAARLVPIVIDVLNFEEQMPHQSEFWGAPSRALAPYSERNLLAALASDRGADLRRIVDPYSYREALTQPKLIVNATNDVFFPIDDLNLYWNGLEGPKHVLYVPNNGHNVNDFGRLIPAVVAFVRAGEGAGGGAAAGEAAAAGAAAGDGAAAASGAAAGTASGPASPSSSAAGGEARDDGGLPSIAWQYEGSGKNVRLCVRSDPAPSGVVLWSAVSEDSDFRDAVFSSMPVSAADGVYVASVPAPDAGFKVAFGELAFGEGESRYMLSTNVRVIDATGRPPAFSAALDGQAGVCPR
jgi:PhoPQ-activated pathogenicity-related protein